VADKIYSSAKKGGYVHFSGKELIFKGGGKGGTRRPAFLRDKKKREGKGIKRSGNIGGNIGCERK